MSKFPIKESRVIEMAAALDKIIGERKVETSTLPSIFGRLQFMESQLLGRAGKLALADIRRLEQSAKSIVNLDEEQVAVFDLLRQRIVSPPRTIPTSRSETPVLIFTDGSCEEVDGELVGAVGAVIFGSESWGSVRAFGSPCPKILDEAMARCWQEASHRTC